MKILLILLSAVSGVALQTADRPNILFIIAAFGLLLLVAISIYTATQKVWPAIRCIAE